MQLYARHQSLLNKLPQKMVQFTYSMPDFYPEVNHCNEVLAYGKHGIVFKGPQGKVIKFSRLQELWRKPLHRALNLLVEELPQDSSRLLSFIPIHQHYVIPDPSRKGMFIYADVLPLIKGKPPKYDPACESKSFEVVATSNLGVQYDIKGEGNAFTSKKFVDGKSHEQTIILETFGVKCYPVLFKMIEKVQSPEKQKEILKQLARYFLLHGDSTQKDWYMFHADNKPVSNAFSEEVLKLAEKWEGKPGKNLVRRIKTVFKGPGRKIITRIQKPINRNVRSIMREQLSK
jgi:hypothetical protein